MLNFLQRVTLALVVATAFPATSSAALITLTNSNFQSDTPVGSIPDYTITGWTGTSSGPILANLNVNVRSAADILNTSNGNAGFQSYFTSNFAALGDAIPFVPGLDAAGIHELSQSFTLPVSSIVTLTFDRAFNGNSGTGIFQDIFRVLVDGVSKYAENSSPLYDGPLDSSLTVNQIAGTLIVNLGTLAAGSHSLTFRLNEDLGDQFPLSFSNTMVGIDNVVLDGVPTTQPPDPTPVVPEPASALLFVIGGLALFNRKRLAN